MPGPSTSGSGRSAAQGTDDGWGPSTAIRGGTRRPAGAAGGAPARAGRAPADPPPAVRGNDWTPAGPAPREQQRSNRVAERRVERSVRELQDRRAEQTRPPERGLPAWAALLVLVGIAVVGGIVDTVASIQVKGGFNIGIVVASIVAILIVKRSHMFPIVIAPPIVYSLAAVFQLYLRSGGLHDKKVVFDAAANYLVYGFPAIAAATAAVLIIAGIRLITRR